MSIDASTFTYLKCFVVQTIRHWHTILNTKHLNQLHLYLVSKENREELRPGQKGRHKRRSVVDDEMSSDRSLRRRRRRLRLHQTLSHLADSISGHHPRRSPWNKVRGIW